MVSGLACRGVAVNVTLDAIVLRATDVNRAALHQEVLSAADAVTCSRSHVDGSVLDGEVLTRLDAVLHVANDVQRTLLRKFGVALDVEAALLRTRRSVAERVGRSCNNLYLDALAVLDVYGSTAIYWRGIGQRQTVELYRRLVRARHIELAVGGCAAQRVGDFLSQVVALGYRHMRPADSRRDVLCHVASNGNSSGCAIITDANRAVSNARFVHRHAIDVGERKSLAHDGYGLAIGVGHLARLRGWELVGHAAHLDVQRLRTTIDN